jgi:hypothetical protein
MRCDEMIRQFRVLAQDKTPPFLWCDDSVLDWLNDAQQQACIRGRLILEDVDDDVCLIDLVDDVKAYALHPAVYEIASIRIGTQPLKLVSREWLNTCFPEWREDDRRPCYAIQDDTRITLVGAVKAGEMRIECYRLPMARMEIQSTPEIHVAHHPHLVQWALHKAFSIPDADGFDQNRSILAEREFSAYFGQMPDSDLRRITREDVVHHNVAILP